MNDPSVCLHEAAHTAVALHLGLAVSEVRVEDGAVMTVPRYCAELYGLNEGISIPAQGCMLDDDCLERDREAVLIAMAAPSCIRIEPMLDLYAEVETTLALAHAEQHGLDPRWILDRAHQCVLMCHDEIVAIAERLETEGVIHGSDLAH
jgi:hypothetical protein